MCLFLLVFLFSIIFAAEAENISCPVGRSPFGDFSITHPTANHNMSFHQCAVKFIWSGGNPSCKREPSHMEFSFQSRYQTERKDTFACDWKDCTTARNLLMLMSAEIDDVQGVAKETLLRCVRRFLWKKIYRDLPDLEEMAAQHKSTEDKNARVDGYFENRNIEKYVIMPTRQVYLINDRMSRGSFRVFHYFIYALCALCFVFVALLFILRMIRIKSVKLSKEITKIIKDE